MNTREKALRILSAVLIIGGVALRISHNTDYGNSHLMTTFGFVFCLMAYGSYSDRLKTENAELRQRLEQREEQ